MNQSELEKQNDLQRKLIHSLLRIGDHLERRTRLVDTQSSDSISSFTEFVAEVPSLIREKVENFQKQGLELEELPMRKCADCEGSYTSKESTTRLCKFCKANRAKRNRSQLPK